MQPEFELLTGNQINKKYPQYLGLCVTKILLKEEFHMSVARFLDFMRKNPRFKASVRRDPDALFIRGLEYRGNRKMVTAQMKADFQDLFQVTFNQADGFEITDTYLSAYPT